MRWLAAVLLLCSGRAEAANPLGAYSFAPTAVEGSARAVGLGGAMVAQPKDYSAVFVNPAGLGGLAGDGVDFGSDSNNIDNFFIDPNDPGHRNLADPLSFSFVGFRYVTANGWGFGFAKQTPYTLDDQFLGFSKVKRGLIKGVPVFFVQGGKDFSEIRAQSNLYTLGAAKSYLDKTLSVGVAVNYIQVSESYNFQPSAPSTPTVSQTATNDGVSADIGLLAKPLEWLHLGAVYKMGYDIPFDPSRNSSALGTNGPVAAFRDGKAPDRLSLGIAVNPGKYGGIFVQSNLVFPMSDTIIIGSGLFPGSQANLDVGRRTTADIHWGAELAPINEPDLTVKLWAGGYLENTGLSVGYRRYHHTAGFNFSPWFLGLSMAVDDSDLYNNFTVGLGVDMFDLSQRIAKKYGWNLPM